MINIAIKKNKPKILKMLFKNERFEPPKGAILLDNGRAYPTEKDYEVINDNDVFLKYKKGLK